MKTEFAHGTMQKVFADIAEHVATPFIGFVVAVIVTIYAIRVISAIVRF